MTKQMRHYILSTDPTSDQMAVSMPVLSTIRYLSSPSLDTIELWVEVDHDLPVQLRSFAVKGTEQDIDPSLEYVGSTEHSDLVFHLYEHK